MMDGCEKFELDMIDYLDAALKEDHMAAFSAHLRACPACSRRLETMRSLMDETAELFEDVPDGLHEKIMAGIGRERKGGRLLRFASRRTAAAVAAVIVLACAASVFGVSRFRGEKGSDAAAMDMIAQNAKSIAVLDEEGSGSAAAAEDDAGDLDGVFYTTGDEAAPEAGESLEEESAAPAEGFAESAGEQDKAELTAIDQPQDLFADIAEDVQYAAVVVMDAEEIPSVLQEYVEGIAEDSSKTPQKDRDEVLYIIVPAEKLYEIVRECRAEEIKLVQYDAENPAPDAELIDVSAETALVVLQVTE